MNRNRLNFVVDLLTFIVALALVSTGLMIYLVLPPGSGRGKLLLLGMDRHAWGELHLVIALVAIALVLLHVALHWPWVCTMVCRAMKRGDRAMPESRSRSLAGIAAVLAVVGLIGGLLWGAAMMVESGDRDPADTPAGQREHRDERSQADAGGERSGGGMRERHRLRGGGRE
ncbi:MAG: DUF4405 domain-containing protein [Phycisphaeraceae bacterium]|nr:DUF4405 domain-containing protein [Phycisphaeraceae bacterium]